MTTAPIRAPNGSLISLSLPTGITGEDLSSLEVVELPQSVFVNVPLEEIFGANVSRAIVPALVFTFDDEGGRRFRALEMQLERERSADLLRARGVAIVIGGAVLATPGLTYVMEEEPVVVRKIEFHDRTFDELVGELQSLLGCDLASRNRGSGR